MKRHRDDERIDESFHDLFGKNPRPVQRDAIRKIEEAREQGYKHAVMEMNTGSGKSLLGLHFLANSKCGKAYYVCSTKSLQTQIARETKECGMKAACMFGKDNYYCCRCVDRIENEHDRGAVKSILSEMKGMDDCPPRDVFFETCKKRGILGHDAKSLWDMICAKKKEKSGEETCPQYAEYVNSPPDRRKGATCAYALAKIRAKHSKVVIINSSLFLTYAQFNLFQEPVDVVFDEAHLLADRAQSFCEQFYPSSFNAEDLKEDLKKTQSLFQHESFDVKRIDAAAQGLRSKPPEEHFLFNTKIVNRLKSIEASGVLEDYLYAECKEILRAKKYVEKFCETMNADNARILTCASEDIVKGLEEEGLEESVEDITNEEAKMLAKQKLQTTGKSALNKWILKKRFADVPQIKRGVGHEEAVEWAKTIKRVIKRLRVLRVAADEEKWTTHERFRDCVPKLGWSYVDNLRREMSRFEFHITPAAVAKTLGEYLWQKPNICFAVFMSATLTDDSKFDEFLKEVGLTEEDTACHAFAPIFDPSKVKIISPKTLTYDYKTENEAFRREQVQWTKRCVDEGHCLNGKSILVTSYAKSEYELMKKNLEPELEGFEHILFKEEPARVARFERDPNVRAVLYGSESLYTGVNYPERVGLVVIPRSMNHPPDHVAKTYQRLYLSEDKKDTAFWKHYAFLRRRRVSQAVGRLQRCDRDRGAVLLLGDGRTGDANVLRKRYS